MIKLNLLLDSYKNRHKIRAKRLMLLVIVLLLVAGVSFWTFYSYIELMQKEGEYKSLLGEYKVIEKKASDAEKVRKELNNYKQQVLLLVKLVEDQPLLSRILNDLGTYIPDDTWIVNFSYSKGKGFSIKGYALSGVSPAKFVEDFSKSQYIKEIKLEDSQRDGDLYVFSISGKFSF